MTSRSLRQKLALGGAALAIAGASTLGTTLTTAAPAQAAGQCVDYQYSYGGYAGCVGKIQTLLNYFRYGKTKLVVDNSFGPKTRQAVIEFQSTFGLYVDGVVGKQTWRILCAPQAGPGPIPGYPYATARSAGCII